MLRINIQPNNRDALQFGVDNSIATQGATALFGPSGSGKTTILKFISGLIKLNGDCSFNDTVWQSKDIFLDAHKRHSSLVMQSPLLFPHMSVQQNIEYAINYGRQKSGEFSLDYLSQVFGLTSLLHRNIQELSGGEQQRLCIARAIASEPKILLLDEPLTGLDVSSKRTILKSLNTIKNTFSMPMIYVSHDLSEVAALCDRVIQMNNGATSADVSTELYLNTFSEQSYDHRDYSVICGTLSCNKDADDKFEEALLVLPLGNQKLLLSDSLGASGDDICVKVYASDVSLSLQHHLDTSILNILKCRVDSIIDSGHQTKTLVLKLDQKGDQITKIKSCISLMSFHRLALEVGHSVYAQIKTTSLF